MAQYLKGFKIHNASNSEQDQRLEAGEKEVRTYQNQQLIQEYNKLKRVYEEERVNQQSHLYLRRIAHDKAKQMPNFGKYPLLQYLTNAAKIMMLNEYEIIAWALWLDNIPLEEDDYTLEEKTLFTALYVKNSLNDDKQLKIIFDEFLSYIHNFIEKFNSWIEK